MKKPEISKNTAGKKAAEKNNIVRKKNEVKQVRPVATAEKNKLKTYDDNVTDAFIKEVDEEVHNDELKVFWNKYGLFVILFVVLAVTAAVSFETIKNWREQQYQAQTESYLSAVQTAENAETTIKALEKIAAGDKGLYSDLARIQIANVLMEQGKDAEAVAALQSIVDNKELNPRITQLAALKLATYKIDTAPRQEIEALLLPIVQTDNSWTPLAQDLLAMTAIRDGDIDQAREIYNNLLLNPNISTNFKSRIQDMLSALNDM